MRTSGMGRSENREIPGKCPIQLSSCPSGSCSWPSWSAGVPTSPDDRRRRCTGRAETVRPPPTGLTIGRSIMSVVAIFST